MGNVVPIKPKGKLLRAYTLHITVYEGYHPGYKLIDVKDAGKAPLIELAFDLFGIVEDLEEKSSENMVEYLERLESIKNAPR